MSPTLKRQVRAANPAVAVMAVPVPIVAVVVAVTARQVEQTAKDPAHVTVVATGVAKLAARPVVPNSL